MSSISKSSFPPPKSPFPRHHRAFSEGFSAVEKPSWLDELLEEPEIPVQRGAHRRSSSDSFAYVEKANTKTNYAARYDGMFDGIGAVITPVSSPWGPQGSGPKVSGEKRDAFRTDSSEAGARRVRQQRAQRSRARQNQYVTELERASQALQATCAAIRGEIEIRRQKNAVVRMQNVAMAMRLESLSQAQLIKQHENEVLEREIKRLRVLNQEQKLANSRGLGNLFAILGLSSDSDKKE